MQIMHKSPNDCCLDCLAKYYDVLEMICRQEIFLQLGNTDLLFEPGTWQGDAGMSKFRDDVHRIS
jgi:hypothetical protein